MCNPSSLKKNSLESMDGGGILTITTDLVQDQVVLRISDTGVGIPPEILPRLFEPFMTHGKSSGTGLGLAIARSEEEAHSGKISLSSVYGSGTTVDIRLPKPSVYQRDPGLECKATAPGCRRPPHCDRCLRDVDF